MIRTVFERVVVVGSRQAGKTTFATELGRRTGLPVINLDHHYWSSGLVATPDNVWRAVQSDLCLRAVAGSSTATTAALSMFVSNELTRSSFSPWRGGGISCGCSDDGGVIVVGRCKQKVALNTSMFDSFDGSGSIRRRLVRDSDHMLYHMLYI